MHTNSEQKCNLIRETKLIRDKNIMKIFFSNKVYSRVMFLTTEKVCILYLPLRFYFRYAYLIKYTDNI